MRGNSQVRFLGEKKVVMPFSYPTEYAIELLLNHFMSYFAKKYAVRTPVISKEVISRDKLCYRI